LVVANTCSSSTCSGQGVMGVLLGNGDGTFQRVVTYNSGGEAAESVVVPTENSVRTESAEVPSIHEILVRSR
jgi:hypothetical protein